MDETINNSKLIKNWFDRSIELILKGSNNILKWSK